MKCDLHTHSLYSDGTCTVAELIAEAKRLNLVIALTDHNTVAGLPDFLSEAEKQGVTAVPGIEFTTSYNNKELHLVGLFIEPEYYDMLEKTAEKYNRLKEISNLALTEKLNVAGYNIDYQSVKKRNLTGNINRSHFALELQDKGYMTKDEAFNTILDEGYGIYEPPERLLLLDAIRMLSEIKALPILAHPLKDIDESTLRNLLPEAIEAGLVGIETHHSSYDNAKILLATQIAEEFGLHQSGGSDFHGGGKGGIYLGVGTGNLSVPVEFYNDLMNLHQSL